MRALELVADRFEIEKQAGAGGMGTVYRARDRHAGGALVALKLVRVVEAADAERFAREASVLADISHPAVVRYIAHGTVSEHERYLAMEWLEGEDLSARLARSGLTVREALDVIRIAADALGAAHARGVVHRDIKPANLFLPGGSIERLKVLDFGIARGGGLAGAVTRTGALVGTPGYMSPEQARGARVIDARADVFALGCVLFECLTGRPAFEGESVMAVLAKVLLDDAPRAGALRGGVPADVDALIARMLAKDAGARPRDGHDVAAEITALARATAESQPEELSAQSRPSAPSLTAHEQRVLSLVAARTAETETRADVDAPTLASTDDAASRAAEVAALAKRHGGRAEYLADGSLVVLLAPRSGSATTDQAARAARCALALRELYPNAPVALATGRGVLAGARPVGDVIDRAAALLAVGRGEGAWVDEVSAALIESRFELVHTPQGVAVVAEREAADPARTVLGRATPFVGRERELATLEAALAECVDEPVARVVLVTGPAGAGKSRLASEFVRRARERYEGLEVWHGRGDAVGAGSSFALVARAIRNAAGVLEGEPAEAQREKLAARVGRFLEPGESAGRVIARVGELAGLAAPVRPSSDDAPARDAAEWYDAAREAWEQWLGMEARAHPLLVLLDDLHWGDLPSVKFIDAALRALHGAPLFVLALARPEVTAAFPAIWAERGVLPMPLGELTRKAAERLVRGVLPGADAESVARIVERAQGNAFYLEEIIRAAEPGGALPDSVVGMVQARLDALGADARRVLRAASVFGQRFWRGGVMTLLGGEQRTTEVHAWLDDLAARELISRSNTARFPGETEYAFRHGLVRDAAYATLTPEDRTLGHRLAGDWLERAGESDAVALAEHFALGDSGERAAEYFYEAARRASNAMDMATARALIARGLAAGPSRPVRARLKTLEARAADLLGDYPTADAAYAEAMEIFETGSRDWFRVAGGAVGALARGGRTDALAELRRKILAQPVLPDAGAEHLECLGSLARQLMNLRGSDADVDTVLAAIDAALARGVTLAAVAELRLVQLRARRAQRIGDLGTMLAAQHRAIDLARAAGLTTDLGFEICHYASMLIDLGDYEAASRATEEAVRIAGRNWAMQQYAMLVRAVAAVGGGADTAAVGALRDAVEQAFELGGARVSGYIGAYATLCLLHAGLDAEAESVARRALASARGQVMYQPAALASLAEVARRAGRVNEALDLAREAHEILARVGGLAPGDEAVRRAHAEALEATGARGEARAVLAEAVEILRRRADTLTDDAVRARYLAAPENAAVLARAREWGVP